MDGIITIDEDRQIIVFNPAAESMFQWSAPDVLGGPLDRLIPKRHRSGHDAHVTGFGESEIVSRKMAAALRPANGLRATGEEFPIDSSISQIEVDGKKLFTVTCRDITDRVEAEKALRDSEERLRQLAENVSGSVWLRDVANNQMLFVSSASESVWGLPAERIYQDADAWVALIHPDDLERVRDHFEESLGRPYKLEFRIIRPDGRHCWIVKNTFPIFDSAGLAYRTASIAEDVTQARQVEEQFHLAQKMEAIAQFSGGVSHDFNNILAAIIMQAGLAETDSPEEMAAALREVVESAKKGATLTRHLLQFSRKDVMRTRPVDLNVTVQATVRMLHRVLGEDILLQTEVAPVPSIVVADPTMIDQIIMNLVVNARDAMPAGGRITISLDHRQVWEGTPAPADLAPGRYVCLAVADTGTGIAADVLPRIFEPFFTTKEPGYGTGLGLPTVFGIARQHGGTVIAESIEGKGMTFTVMLPASDLPVEVASEPEVRAAREDGSESILLIEDEPSVRTAATRLLERRGYRVFPASNGMEAMQAWTLHRETIALVVTDMRLPDGLSGRDILQGIRAEKPGIRALLTSGYSPEIFGREMTLDASERFLTKPYSVSQLLSAVRELLDS